MADLLQGILLIVIGAALFDLLMSKRTGARAGRGFMGEIRKNPNVKAYLKLINSPGFEDFIVDSFKTLKLINEKLPGLLKTAEEFLSPVPVMETLTPEQAKEKERGG